MTASPFYRAIHAPTPPRELHMVANSHTPIHARLWCVEAHKGRQAAVVRMHIGVAPHTRGRENVASAMVRTQSCGAVCMHK